VSIILIRFILFAENSLSLTAQGIVNKLPFGTICHFYPYT